MSTDVNAREIPIDTVPSISADHFGARGPVGVRLDTRTGLPVALVRRDGALAAVPVTVGFAVVTGGHEVIGSVGGLTYAGTTREWLGELRLVSVVTDDEGSTSKLLVCSRTTRWTVEIEYRLAEHPPHVGLGFTLRRNPGDEQPVLVRDVALSFHYELTPADDWTLNAPGNQFRADLAVDDRAAALIVRGAAEGEGSAGLIAFTRTSTGHTTVLWPVCTTEIGEIDVSIGGRGDALITISTGMAARLSARTDGVAWRTAYLDSLPTRWPQVRSSIAGWWRRIGLEAPRDTPEWFRRAHIYEAYIGYSVFLDGHRFERYPTIASLRDDLARISDLGFDVLQLMPQHPYPSYNVHDYLDISTTYGDEAQLRELVAECHRLGMRVLLDVILHGVVDKEVVDETLASVHAGPFAARLGDGAIDFLARSPEDIAWARHIVEYAPYWREGAPERHRLVERHPEWFMRDSRGAITRRYTKAFDIAHPAWQRYFIDACDVLVRRLGIDGFRIDAPTYNDFANWLPERDGRTSYTALAALDLLRDLRARLRAAYGDVVVYTEPTGSLWRAVADATYNYDEHWLVEALLGPPRPKQQHQLVCDARQLTRWLHDRDSSLPPGATIVHHVDSHDSIWWRLPGEQWRLERFGAEATAALVAVFSLLGGAFMTFMGGERGIEQQLRRAHELRRRLPEIRDGMVDYAGAESSSDHVLAVLRHTPAAASLVAVNLSDRATECDVRVATQIAAPRLLDHWNQEWLEPAGSADDRLLHLTFDRFQPRVVRLRPGGSTADGDSRGRGR